MTISIYPKPTIYRILYESMCTDLKQKWRALQYVHEFGTIFNIVGLYFFHPQSDLTPLSTILLVHTPIVFFNIILCLSVLAGMRAGRWTATRSACRTSAICSVTSPPPRWDGLWRCSSCWPTGKKLTEGDKGNMYPCICSVSLTIIVMWLFTGKREASTPIWFTLTTLKYFCINHGDQIWNHH